jgi:hypothetical protein
VLECVTGKTNTVVAHDLRLTKQTIGKWRTRFLGQRLDGLLDERTSERSSDWRTVLCGGAGEFGAGSTAGPLSRALCVGFGSSMAIASWPGRPERAQGQEPF